MRGVPDRGCIHGGLALWKRPQILSSASPASDKANRLRKSRLPPGRRVAPNLPNHQSVVSQVGQWIALSGIVSALRVHRLILQPDLSMQAQEVRHGWRLSSRVLRMLP